MPDKNEGRRIVILGGGCGAMAAAFWLTDDPAWRRKFSSIVVYQQGWRLGGKGAAGRGAGNRIEEHGLHLWGGFYPNAFHMMRRCYELLERPPSHPLATWDKAFVPANGFSAEEYIGETWRPWVATFPPREGLPGDIDPSTGQPFGPPQIPWMMSRSVDWLSDRIDEYHLPAELAERKQAVVDSLRSFGNRLLIEADLAVDGAPRRVSALAFMPRNEWADESRNLRQRSLDLLGTVHSLEDDLRRLRIITEIVLTCAAGILDDGVIHRGFDAIDDVHLGDWLARHGASKEAIQSAIVNGGYDYVFAYLQGDVSKPSLSAGVALRGFIRLVFGFRGALFWKMHHGMGDAVFAPLYELLLQRGVEFRFFSCVKALSLSTDDRRIASIRINRQARLASKEAKTGTSAYEPLVRRTDGLECWPAMPLLGQLQDGGTIGNHWSAGELEGGAAADQGSDEVTLLDSRDFDAVVLGIPVTELRTVCADLGAKLPSWRTMLECMPSVPTLSCQLWLQKPLAGADWTPAGVDIVTNYAQPFNTLANMSHLVQNEDTGAKAVVYLCGPLPQSLAAPGASQAEANDAVQALVKEWLAKHAHVVMPAFKVAGLVDFGDAAGDRFASQYFRANISPSEQYVLSVPGTASVRLSSDGSGVDNLFLAGDWTRNGWNAGCVEGAVVSGLRAARALLGDPRPIPGELD